MTQVNPAFTIGMSDQQQKTRAIKDAEQAVARTLRQIGPSEAVSRFMSRYAKVRTQKAYCTSLLGYLKWMKPMKSVSMTPDELVRDNLRCVYGSAPEDVATKRRHADWLNEYVNVYMISKNASEAKKMQEDQEITSRSREEEIETLTVIAHAKSFT